MPCCLRTLLPNFYPRPPRGGRPAQLARASAAEAISIHALREEGDRTDTYFAGMPRISIHALREEGDFLRGQSSCARANFYPRPPRGGRRHSGGSYRQRTDFYPRPPRGGRPNGLVAFANGYIFLSTPSAKRATRCLSCHLFNFTFLSTPSARRATSSAPGSSSSTMISIHALREEGDARTRAIMCLTFTFLSTPSARRATTAYQRQTCSDTDFYPRPPRGGRPLALSLEPCDQLISIHALREEGDNIGSGKPSGRTYFYPRPPRGGRQNAASDDGVGSAFLSTPSARRATEDAAEKLPAVQISIHALREEGDTKAYANGGETCHFYPRPPRGGRPKPTHPRKKAHQFLSTPSARRATRARAQ